MNTKADFLRSEIEKLEGMKTAYWKSSLSVSDEIAVTSYNTAIANIITRYKEELKVLDSK